jgi:glycosyltransferase involved in cell wall biosynthesis
VNKLLTIAIPTFNRAQKLDWQITWLAKVIKGFESECEVFISNNCSTDNTQDVIAKWQSELGRTVLKSNRSSENVGLVRNIACCLNAARTPFVWMVGDGDPIQDRNLTYVLETLKKYSDIALLLLNFSARDRITGLPVKPLEVVGDRWADRA